MKEPIWRQVVCWGATLFWLSIPSIIGVYIIFDLPKVPLEDRVDFMLSVYYGATGLLTALLGLNSWDKKNGTRPVDSSKTQR